MTREPGRTPSADAAAGGNLGGDAHTLSAGLSYLHRISSLVETVRTAQYPQIRAAARLIADAIARGRPLHVFGTGHSHMIAEEAYYRAGGLVEVRPLLFEGLMLHADAALSTSLERLPGLAGVLLDHHPMPAGDVLIISSNSGANPVTVEMARLATAAGVRLIVITSMDHATSTQVRVSTGAERLHDYADVVIDNGGVVGDAAITITGVADPFGPTSTVIGAAILNAIVCDTVEELASRGVPPPLFRSANVIDGDDHNAPWLTETSP